MCWICNKESYRGIQVAQSDIPIFKAVDKKDNGEYVSELYKFVYTLNEVTPEEILVVRPNILLSDAIYTVNRGYHSCYFKGLKVLSEKELEYNRKYILRIVGHNAVIVKGIIPKKSLYLASEDGMLVSNQIILQEEIDLSKELRKHKIVSFY